MLCQNGKPTPKEYVWDGVRLVWKKANSKRVPGYRSDLWKLDPVTRAKEWEKYPKGLEEKKKEEDKDKSSPAIKACFSAPAMLVEQNVYMSCTEVP